MRWVLTSEFHALWSLIPSGINITCSAFPQSTNRTLLRWLKQWDYVVFGKEREKKDKKPKEKSEKEKTGNHKAPWVAAAEALRELDDHNRPMHKVVMLHGPPGLGKTTLAHVVAKHAGYNVVEMNARWGM